MAENENPENGSKEQAEAAEDAPEASENRETSETAKQGAQDEFLLPPQDPPAPPSKAKQVLKSAFIAGVLLAVAGGAGLLSYLNHLDEQLPRITRLDEYRPNVISHVYDANGKKIWEFFKEQRVVLPLERIPEQVQHAFIAAEDAGFYGHSGIDFIGILRAAITNIKAGGIKQGASTITQQVARSFFLSPERKYVRKLKEVLLARRIEERLSKDEILMLYLNQIYLGAGAYGVAAAADIYFHKQLDELTLAEAATIAGVTPRPAHYAPSVNPDLALKRRRYVLNRMLSNDFITQEEHDEAQTEKIVAHERVLPHQKWPHMAYAMEEVRQKLVEILGEDELFRGQLSVVTSFIDEHQQSAYRATRKGIERMDKRQGYRGPLEHIEDEVERSAWLAATGEELLARLRREEFDPEKDGPPFEIDQIRTGMVTGFGSRVGESASDPDVPYAEVTLAANQSGTIALPDMEWAREPDPDENPKYGKLKHPNEALSVGDVVEVRISAIKADEARGAEPLSEDAEGAYLPAYSYELSLYQEPVVQGALLSLDPNTGRIRAMVGGYDYETSKFNRAVQALRQPGSAFKPIIFSKALSHGYTASSTILDAPVTYQGASDDEVWKPKNYIDRFSGEVTLREALTRSINTIPVKILMELGIDYTINYARDLGIESELAHDPTLALGSSSVTLLDLCRAYSVFANGGYRINATMIEQVRAADGQLLYEKKDPWHRAANPELPPPAPEVMSGTLELPHFEDGDEPGGRPGNLPMFGPWIKPAFENMTLEERARRITRVSANARRLGRVTSPAAAYVMTNLLHNVISRGTGHRAAALGRPAAGKTGTSNNNVDAWFLGYTPHLLTGTWVGYDDRTSLGHFSAGGNTGAPMWLDHMQTVLADEPVADFAVPEGVVFAAIDAESGKLSRPGGEGVVFQAYLDGTQPTEYVEDANEIKPEDFFNVDTDLAGGEGEASLEEAEGSAPPSAEDILNLP